MSSNTSYTTAKSVDLTFGGAPVTKEPLLDDDDQARAAEATYAKNNKCGGCRCRKKCKGRCLLMLPLVPVAAAVALPVMAVGLPVYGVRRAIYGKEKLREFRQARMARCRARCQARRARRCGGRGSDAPTDVAASKTATAA